jgi:hypothetical protein
MAFYIWLNDSGKETRREIKGRGRNKADAIEAPDGNFYLKETTVATTVNATAKETEKQPVKEQVTKTIVASKQVSLKDFLDKCFYSPADFTRNGQCIEINRPNTYEIELGAIRQNSAYSAFKIDTKENTISVWILVPTGNPSFVVKNAFLQG